jgi:DNA-binding response OmpR family regulator
MNPSPLIVVVEDEEHLAQGLIFNLQAEGYRTVHYSDGSDALSWLLTTDEEIGVIVLDVMLPGADGFEIVKALRDHALYFPVLMLTARSNPQDILSGLEAGADDYLPKPFDLEILLARVKTLLRRAAWSRPTDSAAPSKPSTDLYQFANRAIYFDSLEMHAPDRVIRLTLMEADLLRYFIEHEGRIVPRKDILEQVWHLQEDTDTRAIDNFIVRLRRYLEDDPASPKHLLTVRGIGYRFLANP